MAARTGTPRGARPDKKPRCWYLSPNRPRHDAPPYTLPPLVLRPPSRQVPILVPRPHQQKRLNHPLAAVRRSLFASSPLLSCPVWSGLSALFSSSASYFCLYLYELPLLALFFLPSLLAFQGSSLSSLLPAPCSRCAAPEKTAAEHASPVARYFLHPLLLFAFICSIVAPLLFSASYLLLLFLFFFSLPPRSYRSCSYNLVAPGPRLFNNPPRRFPSWIDWTVPSQRSRLSIAVLRSQLGPVCRRYWITSCLAATRPSFCPYSY